MYFQQSLSAQSSVTLEFQLSSIDQFSETHCSHSVNINASRTFQQFSQISCTIINKPVNMHESRPNVLRILMTATQVSLSWLLMNLNVVFFFFFFQKYIFCVISSIWFKEYENVILFSGVYTCKVLGYRGKTGVKSIFPGNCLWLVMFWTSKTCISFYFLQGSFKICCKLYWWFRLE